MKLALFSMAFLLMVAETMASDPTWSTPKCKCIKNENGACMSFSKHGPRYSRGSGTQFQFLPTCVDDCLPGYVAYETATFHPRTDTLKEMDHCYIDWRRLRKLNPQWSDPNWTP